MSVEPEHVIDATVDELPDAPATTAAAHELVLRPTREALTPLDSDQVIASMRAYQALLPRLLEPTDFQDAGNGKKFVKRSGWRKIARAFNLSLTLVEHRVDRDAEGNPIRAEVIVRAIAPNGQVQDGDGYCSIDEPRFEDARGRQKIENDLRATATTRAKSRAIADLVGMGDVSAEEINASASALLDASEELQGVTRNAVAYLLDGDVGAADELIAKLVGRFDDRLPAVAGQTVAIVAKAVKDHRESMARP